MLFRTLVANGNGWLQEVANIVSCACHLGHVTAQPVLNGRKAGHSLAPSGGRGRAVLVSKTGKFTIEANCGLCPLRMLDNLASDVTSSINSLIISSVTNNRTF